MNLQISFWSVLVRTDAEPYVLLEYPWNLDELRPFSPVIHLVDDLQSLITHCSCCLERGSASYSLSTRWLTEGTKGKACNHVKACNLYIVSDKKTFETWDIVGSNIQLQHNDTVHLICLSAAGWRNTSPTQVLLHLLDKIVDSLSTDQQNLLMGLRQFRTPFKLSAHGQKWVQPWM